MHYRETVVWRKAMDVVREVYRLAPRLPKAEIYGLRSQLTRAAVSVSANIAEGWTRESVREKRQFLSVAHGSLAELETLLTICEEAGFFDAYSTGLARDRIDEVSRILTTMRRNRRDRKMPA
ncbi:MAG: four helix bundle protein [Proteobacteria bacterium]|nr:four helix bundle protein [Pseudomonadota bacterium]